MAKIVNFSNHLNQWEILAFVEGGLGETPPWRAQAFAARRKVQQFR